jgi:hypothetical protein
MRSEGRAVSAARPFPMRTKSYIPYLQVAPLAFVFGAFLVVPILTIIVVSFWDYDFARIIPDSS